MFPFIILDHFYALKAPMNPLRVSLPFSSYVEFVYIYFSPLVPTLIETIWPENLLPMIPPKIFPSDLSLAKRSSECNGIIQAVGTTIDSTGLLWVIDTGSEYCLPKLLVFDLMKNEEVNLSINSNAT